MMGTRNIDLFLIVFLFLFSFEVAKLKREVAELKSKVEILKEDFPEFKDGLINLNREVYKK